MREYIIIRKKDKVVVARSCSRTIIFYIFNNRYNKKDYQEKIQQEKKNTGSQADEIIKGLGGKHNIISVDNCFTRLRVAIHDLTIVDDAALKATGANGVVRNSNEVQVIYGVKVGQVRSKVDTWLANN